MLTDRMASPPAWTPGYRVQACRSGESAIAAEALMNNAGSAARGKRSGFVWPIWLVSFTQTNQTDRTDQMNKSELAHRFSKGSSER
jgi:hypothetical protein